MKAIIQKKYGGTDKLQLVEVPTPTIKDNEVLIEVYAANVASGDMRINTLDVPLMLRPLLRLIFGFTGPRKQIRGVTGSGKIVKIGPKVTTYKIGDRVNYINSMGAGCMAEYLSLKETSVMSKIHDNVSYNDAAPIPFGAMSAYHFINEDSIKQGDKVLIYGASGSVGSYALQLAKFYGAHVTAVTSKKNHDAMKSIGADAVIDYKTEDFRKTTDKYDVIFDAVLKINKKQVMEVLNPNGTFLSIKSLTKEKSSRIKILNDLLSKNEIKTLIDKVYDINEYKEAHKHVYGKHKVGNVVIEFKKQ